jgi:hypothetical protein
MKTPASFKKLNLLTLILLGAALLMSSSAWGATLTLKNGVDGYEGAEDFYTYFLEGGTFNSKVNLDQETLKVAPDVSDTKSVMRFSNIPLSSGSYRSVSRVALVLTFKSPGTSDTIMVHNLNNGDLWDELDADYNTLNGSAPWSGIDGKLVDAWTTTNGVANVAGGESARAKLVIEFHPNDSSSLRALLDSWMDGNNQGFVIRGINGLNEFYSSSAYSVVNRPELIIEY